MAEKQTFENFYDLKKGFVESKSDVLMIFIHFYLLEKNYRPVFDKVRTKKFLSLIRFLIRRHFRVHIQQFWLVKMNSDI